MLNLSLLRTFRIKQKGFFQDFKLDGVCDSPMHILFALAVLLSGFAPLGAAPSAAEQSKHVPAGYSLAWQDEFNAPRQPGAAFATPDPAEWTYETGAHGWGNNELQNYISGKEGKGHAATISDGTLKITLHKNATDKHPLSARINTKRSWKYGYFEARLKLPTGKGTWPAFWMMPATGGKWPDCGEIDIMEEVGRDPNVIHSTIHCKAYNHSRGTQKGKQIKVPTAESEFHIYAVEWTEDFIRGFVDGQRYFEFPNDKKGNKDTWPFDVPFYLKLNLAWGGNWGGGGKQDVDKSKLPATYEIDYVRVYQKKLPRSAGL
ncbi:MAG: glycoside hydrolase family 16 protein [Puniceicoccales bacterium]|nr:glycoside hydrolase family 16 protein [Puniceicoccales bacterium]